MAAGSSLVARPASPARGTADPSWGGRRARARGRGFRRPRPEGASDAPLHDVRDDPDHAVGRGADRRLRRAQRCLHDRRGRRGERLLGSRAALHADPRRAAVPAPVAAGCTRRPDRGRRRARRRVRHRHALRARAAGRLPARLRRSGPAPAAHGRRRLGPRPRRRLPDARLRRERAPGRGRRPRRRAGDGGVDRRRRAARRRRAWRRPRRGSRAGASLIRPFQRGVRSKMLRSMTSVKRDITPLDVLLTVVFVAFSILFMVSALSDEGGSWVAVPLFALVALPLLWRRVAPIQALCGFIAAIALHVVLFGTVTRCGLVFPVEFFLVFAAGARLGLRGALAGWVLGVAAACLTLGWDQSAPIADAGVYICVLLTGIWVIARLVHLRGRNVVRLQEQTAALREARDERARLEVAMDRARLSADL